LEKIEATGESRMVRPGQQIWARKTSEKDPSSRVAVAATAIVRDKDGKRKILLPDFALLDLSLDGETEYRLTPEGPVISRAGKRDLAYPKGQGSVVGRGVVLAELENDVAALKVPVNSPSDIAGVARLPPLGSVLSILTLRKRGSAKIASIEDDLLVTVDSHITAPGDAGAPVLDERGNLVAMGHSVASNVSRFLSVNWVFDQQGVQLLR
jgi:predicted aconitase with swiveling domain